MKKILKGLLPGLMIVTLATPGFAENRGGAATVSPFIGGYVLDHDQHEENNVIYGLRAGYNFTKNWGAEAMFGYSLTDTKAKYGSRETDVYRYGIDILYHFMPDNKFVPFIAVGGGGTNFNTPNTPSAKSHYAGLVDYGVGVKYFVTDNIALRGDVRHAVLIHDLGEHNLEYSAGLTFQFGGKAKTASALVAQPVEPAPAASMDSDGDGVPDNRDRCPGTPAGVAVDKDGCPLDSDRDGVPDYLDKCPDTPAGVAVDKDGCPPVAEKVVILASEPKVEEKVVAVVSEKKAEVVILAFEDVHFEFNQSNLKPEAKTILKRNIQLLKENPKAQIRIAGYTSASGTEAYNQKLSERRAQSVKEYLVSEGVITSDRLATIGYGETHPAVHESAPKDLYSPAAKSNMRVLFEITVQ